MRASRVWIWIGLVVAAIVGGRIVATLTTSAYTDTLATVVLGTTLAVFVAVALWESLRARKAGR